MRLPGNKNDDSNGETTWKARIAHHVHGFVQNLDAFECKLVKPDISFWSLWSHFPPTKFSQFYHNWIVSSGFGNIRASKVCSAVACGESIYVIAGGSLKGSDVRVQRGLVPNPCGQLLVR